MSGQHLGKLADKNLRRSASTHNEIAVFGPGATIKRSFVMETLCIPMLMIIHRLLYNLSGFLLDQQERDYGAFLISPLDPAIPYLPIFVLPYFGTWLLGLAVLAYVFTFNTGNIAVFRSIYASVVFTTFLEFVFWLCFPASISLRVDMNELMEGGIFDLWLATIYASATPWNVFPSAHVAFAFMAWLYSSHLARREHRIWFQLVCVLICLSVVFVRNHYLVDIPAGLAVTYLGYRLVFQPSLNSNFFANFSTAAVLLMVAIICIATIGASLSIMGEAWSL